MLLVLGSSTFARLTVLYLATAILFYDLSVSLDEENMAICCTSDKYK